MVETTTSVNYHPQAASTYVIQVQDARIKNFAESNPVQATSATMHMAGGLSECKLHHGITIRG